MIVIDEPFRQRIARAFGAEGAAWLERLPGLVAELAERWQLTVQPPFALSYNYVAPVTRADGAEAVLKLGVPHPELATEMAALERYAGRGLVRLLELDRERSAMLLERIRPGTPLTQLAAQDDEEATRIAARLMRQLRLPTPPEHPFPSLERWLRGIRDLRARFAGGTGPLPARLVEQAEAYRDELLASPGPPVVLHADLHHDNILQTGENSWRAIDPKGVVGEAAYEVGTLLHNPWPDLLARPEPGRVLARRVDLLVETLELDRQRILRWGVVNAVLSACWSTEGGGESWRFPIACAELLAGIR